MSSPTLTEVYDAIQTKYAASGFFDRFPMHEPKAAPGDAGEITAATWLQRTGPAPNASGLNATSGRVELITRIYTSMLSQMEDRIDPRCYEAADAVVEMLSGDFSLGGLVRNVDLLGANGEPLSMRAGYLNQSGVLYRTFDVIVPLIINDLWSQIA